jgi:hypothetical protein
MKQNLLPVLRINVLRDTDYHSHAYNTWMMSDHKSVANVQRNAAICIKVHSVFVESIHKLKIHKQQNM